MGNGESLKAWKSRWLPRPHSFLPIPWCHDIDMEVGVAKLIDKDGGCWREHMVRRLFLPIDAEQILRIPLCMSWPADKLIWHFTTSGNFSVKSAYHLLRSLKSQDKPSASMATGHHFWKKIWSLGCHRESKFLDGRLGWEVLLQRIILLEGLGVFQRVVIFVGTWRIRTAMRCLPVH